MLSYSCPPLVRCKGRLSVASEDLNTFYSKLPETVAAAIHAMFGSMSAERRASEAPSEGFHRLRQESKTLGIVCLSLVQSLNA